MNQDYPNETQMLGWVLVAVIIAALCVVPALILVAAK